MQVKGPRDLLLTLPCVRRDRLTALEKHIGGLSEKKRKQLFKDFLQDIIVDLSTGGSGSAALKAKKVVVKGTSALQALKRSAAKEDQHVSTAGLYGDEWDDL